METEGKNLKGKEAFIRKLLDDLCDRIKDLPSVKTVFPEGSKCIIEPEKVVTAIGDGLRACSDLDVFSLWPKTRAVKSTKTSSEARERGNRLLAEKNFVGALSGYNEAVMHGSHEDGSYVMALANRSLVLQKMKMRGRAVRDLKLAISSGYPEGKQYKLYQRLVVLQREMGDLDDALETLELVQQSLKLATDGLSAKNKVSMHHAAEKDKKQIKKDQPDQETPFRVLSPAVEVAYCPDRGRYCVASRDIQSGEVLLKEQPIVARVHLREQMSHCFHCLKESMLAPLPCKECTGVVFCSEECVEIGWKSHAYECTLSLSDALITHGVQGSGFLTQIFAAYRCITQQPPEFFTTNATEIFCLRPGENSSQLIEYDPADAVAKYRTFGNMMLHVDPVNLVERLAVTVLLLKCLEATGYLKNERVAVSNGAFGFALCEKDFFAYAMFHFYGVFLSNNHTIQEMVIPSKDTNGIVREPVGLAIYPAVASILNHSCDPNTAPVVDKDLWQITVATRKIKKGEEICHIYQTHFGDTPKSKRQETLRQMFSFDCNCIACTKDYNMASGIPKNLSDPATKWKNKKQSKKCIADYDALSERVSEASEAGNVALALKLYCQRLDLACDHVKGPHMALLSGRAAIMDCLWVLKGKKTEAARRVGINGVYM